jgi:glycosyltransferase involved in cell wall biosynthesis
MHAALYRPFADPWRQSMRVYADQLDAHLRAVAPADDTFALVSLPGARLSPPARYWDQYVRYQRLARRTPADVHHILDHGYAHLATALPAGRIVVTFHDATPIRSGRASRGTRHALEAGMRRARAQRARFITGSEASRRDAEELFGVDASAITVVPYGVDARYRPAGDRDALRRRLGLSRPAVLIVGHTQPYMNVEGALRAAAAARAGVDFEIIKIGAPLTVAQGALAAGAGLRDHVRELGIIDDDRLADWYAAADALLYLPALSGFGLPVLEAMASGLPVVASDTGGVVEVAGRAAVLVDPRDAAGTGRALASILGDDARRAELARLGPARAREFSWRRTAEQTLGVYRDVAHAA